MHTYIRLTLKIKEIQRDCLKKEYSIDSSKKLKLTR